MSQQTIDFSRSTRLRAIDDLKLPPMEKSPGLLFRVKSLLRCIDDFAGKESRCWASMQSIADKLGCSLRNAKRIMADCVRLELVDRVLRGQHATAFHDVNWNRVFDWSSESPDFPVATAPEVTRMVPEVTRMTSGVTRMSSRGDSQSTPTVKGTDKGTEKRTSICVSAFENEEFEPISEPSEGGCLTITEAFQPRPSLEEQDMTQGLIRFEETDPASDSAPQPPVVVDPPRMTWISPYADVWFDIFEGEMPCSVFAAPLRKLENVHGSEETLRRWENYCESHRGRGPYANAGKFSQTWGQWAGRPGSLAHSGLRAFLRKAEEREVAELRAL